MDDVKMNRMEFGEDTIDETCTVLGMWFAGGPQSDLLMMVWRDATSELHMAGRVRFRVDDKVWGSNDLKRWFRAKPKSEQEAQAGDDVVIERTREHVKLMANGILVNDANEFGELIVKGDLHAFMEAIKACKAPWLNMATPDEAVAMGMDPAEVQALKARARSCDHPECQRDANGVKLECRFPKEV